jgi:hypothetical protein
MVDSAFTTIPRTASAALISRSVIPAWLDTMARSSSACFSSRGRREPPIFAGAELPVWRTRCISLIAASLPPAPQISRLAAAAPSPV